MSRWQSSSKEDPEPHFLAGSDGSIMLDPGTFYMSFGNKWLRGPNSPARERFASVYASCDLPLVSSVEGGMHYAYHKHPPFDVNRNGKFSFIGSWHMNTQKRVWVAPDGKEHDDFQPGSRVRDVDLPESEWTIRVNQNLDGNTSRRFYGPLEIKV